MLFFNSLYIFFKQRLSNRWLAAVIIIGHLHAIFLYGATFWVDSEAYVYLSQVFESGQKARSIMEDPTLWIYTAHIPLGEPLVWHLISKLPTSCIWPAMAFIQHAAGVLSQIYLFSTLNTIRSSRLLIIPCILMSFFPFYQAMHNSLMTEAISGACLLAALAACLRLAYAPRKRDYAYLALSGFGAFFRVYFVVVPFFALFLLFVFRKISFLRAFSTGCFCAVGVVLSSVWILGTTGQIWIPNLGMSAMWQHSVFAPATPPAVVAYVETLPWPDEEIKRRLLSGDFTRFDTIATSLYWQKNGMTREQAFAASKRIGALFLEQPEQWKRKITAALICMGLPAADLWLPESWLHTRNPDGKMAYLHQMAHYKYLSWVAPSEGTYNPLSSPPYFHDGPEHSLLKAAWQPYLNFSSPERARDILGLSQVPLAVWVSLGVGSCIVMFLRGNALPGILFSGTFSLLFFSFYLTNIPDIRYSYLALLLYFSALATATAMAENKKFELSA